MKDFFDRTDHSALERINGRPYAILICAGSDGQNAARKIARIATGWRLRAGVADPLVVCTHAQTPEAIFAPKAIASDDLDRCEELGAAMAAGLAMGIFLIGRQGLETDHLPSRDVMRDPVDRCKLQIRSPPYPKTPANRSANRSRLKASTTKSTKTRVFAGSSARLA